MMENGTRLTQADWRRVRRALRSLSEYITDWRQRKGFTTGWHNFPEKLMLIVTELGEAMEAYRLWLPRRDEAARHAIEEELADTLIRLLDLTAAVGMDMGAAVERKMGVNECRPLRHGKGC